MCSSGAWQTFYRSSAIHWAQGLTTASMIAKQSLSFWLTIDWLSYCSIGLHSTILYYLFIIEKSYEDLGRNVSNTFRSINDHMHTLCVNQLINLINLLFFKFISIICQWSNDFQIFCDIIIYTIHWSSSDQPLIIIKRKVIEIVILSITSTLSVLKLLYDQTIVEPFYNIIINTIYGSSSDQNLNVIKM